MKRASQADALIVCMGMAAAPQAPQKPQAPPGTFFPRLTISLKAGYRSMSPPALRYAAFHKDILGKILQRRTTYHTRKTNVMSHSRFSMDSHADINSRVHKGLHYLILPAFHIRGKSGRKRPDLTTL